MIEEIRALVGERLDELDGVVARYAGPNLVYQPPLDSLKPQNYLDHSHVDHAGYQLLADAIGQRLRPLLEGATP